MPHSVEQVLAFSCAHWSEVGYEPARQTLAYGKNSYVGSRFLSPYRSRLCLNQATLLIPTPRTNEWVLSQRTIACLSSTNPPLSTEFDDFAVGEIKGVELDGDTKSIGVV